MTYYSFSFTQINRLSSHPPTLLTPALLPSQCKPTSCLPSSYPPTFYLPSLCQPNCCPSANLQAVYPPTTSIPAAFVPSLPTHLLPIPLHQSAAYLPTANPPADNPSSPYQPSAYPLSACPFAITLHTHTPSHSYPLGQPTCHTFSLTRNPSSANLQAANLPN